MKIVSSILSWLSALLFFFWFALSPNLVLAQQFAAAVAAPRIDGFDVEPARRLTAGNELTFTLYGTPGGTASARISAVARKIVLEEVEAGVYEGTYTIKKTDHIGATTSATANLRVGNQIATALLDESLLAGAAAPAIRPAVLASASSFPLITRFDLDPPANLTAGEQLFFTLRGTPEGKASVRIAGVKGKLSLEEMQSGVYEGAYTINNRDRIASNAAVTATLNVGSRDASATLNRSLVAGAAPIPSPRRAEPVCANCGVVEAVNVVEVKGDGSYLGKIAGGVVGGLLGSQVGQGKGTTAAEVAGVVGGAVIGNEIEKRTKKSKHYDVIARLQGGGAQTITYATEPSFRVGDRVRVENGVFVSN